MWLGNGGRRRRVRGSSKGGYGHVDWCYEEVEFLSVHLLRIDDR